MRNLILSGGPFHPFEATSSSIALALSRHGVHSTLLRDLSELTHGLRHLEPELLTVNALRWRMMEGEHADLRERWGTETPAALRDAIEAHLARGGGLLAVHAASICFDDWPRWGEILGAAWDWQRSHHPPLGTVRVSIADTDHPIVAGLEDFELRDELYSDLSFSGDVEPLATGAMQGEPDTRQPVLWARPIGSGRVVYSALGHDETSVEHPTHERLLLRCALWAGGADAEALHRA